MRGSFPSRFAWVCIGFLVIGAFFLITEHRAHAFGLLPFLLLLACPLLHMLTHRGHGGHGSAGPEHHHGQAEGRKEGTP